MLVRLELKRLGEVVDGDAPIAAASHSDDLYEPVMERSSPPPVSDGARTSKRGATAAQGYAYEVNKKRKGLCKAFQKGKCERCAKGSTICPRNSALRHQCANCLAGDHGGGLG